GTGDVDPGLRWPDLRHVVGDDGCDDAAGCRANAASLRARQPHAESPRPSVRAHRVLRRRLPYGLGRLQRPCRRIAVGIGATRPAGPDDDRYELLARRGHPACGRVVGTDPAQGHLPAPLPLTAYLPRAAVAARPARSLSHGDRARRVLPRLLLVLDE